jgi:hypothetical protein
MAARDFVVESPDLSDVICLQKPVRLAERVRATEAVIASRLVDAAW